MEYLLTIEEVAQRLRVDPTTVRRWIVEGLLPAVEMPLIDKQKQQRYRIKQSTLDKILSPVHRFPQIDLREDQIVVIRTDQEASDA